MSVTFITPAQLTITEDNTWRDIDVSASVSDDATGVILEVISTNEVGAHYKVGLRKNGSTDTEYGRQVAHSHMWCMIGLDDNKIFEARVENADIELWIFGYTEGEAVFFDNSVDVTPGSNSTWEDQDISSDTGADTALAAIVYATQGDNLSGTSAARENGSTDSRPDSTGMCMYLVGVDGSEILETFTSNTTNVTMSCVGYFTDGISMNTNGVDRSLGTTGSYQDLTALDSSATGGIYDVFRASGSGYATRWNIRDKGGTHDIYRNCSWEKSWAIVPTGTSQTCEAKIENTGSDFYEMGYFFDVVTASTGLPNTGSGSVTSHKTSRKRRFTRARR